jgi:DNA-binding transcriptional MerR regulator
MKKLSVTLKLFYGAVTYDIKGNVTSKAENISLQYGTPEWVNYLKHLRANGITKAEVLNVYDLNEVNEKESVESLKRYKEVEGFEEIQDEVNESTKTPTAELTPEQKQIKDLQEMVAKLQESSSKQQQVNPNENSELKIARDEYEKLFGKKGGPTWTVEQINQKIEDFKVLEATRVIYLEVVGEKADDALTVEELQVKIKEKQS